MPCSKGRADRSGVADERGGGSRPAGKVTRLAGRPVMTEY